MANIVESVFKFTDPIRYFKSNDPIYYEVDNIPLKQLQENDLWLKDQILGAKSQNIQQTILDRSSFSELKPFCLGADNIVSVMPGRFTARINDAYSITRLQYIHNTLGTSIGSNYEWEAKSALSDVLIEVVHKFKEELSSEIVREGLNMNGLAERVFSYPAMAPSIASPYLRENSAGTRDISNPPDGINISQPPYPIIQAQFWPRFLTNNYIFTTKQISTVTNVGLAVLPSAESEFIKRWRGVARTAIVDFPVEDSIEIPSFDPEDFYYIDSDGNKTILETATQRIDLLFIYSKPIDTSSTTIAKFMSGGQPTSITKPQLGLVRGAGIGVDYRNSLTISKDLISSKRANGSISILPHIADINSRNTGFLIDSTIIKGSFPSPDDLMNLTPILDTELSQDHYGLIGQSILPIAYIVVKKTAVTNEETGVGIITSQDIIDIRPFFRTTELSYNERAGIAAAIPAASLANPICTRAELNYEITRIYRDLLSKIPVIPPPSTTTAAVPTIGKIIGAGTICGGFFYGVESVLGREIAESNSNLSIDAIKQKIKSDYNYDRPINDYPDWDIASWCNDNSGGRIAFPKRGQLPNDYITQVNSPFFGKNDVEHLFRDRPFMKFAYLLIAPTAQMGANPLSNNEVISVDNWRTTVTAPFPGAKTQGLSDGQRGGSAFGGGINMHDNGPPYISNRLYGQRLNMWSVTYCTKKIKIILPTGINSFDVNAQFFNCVAATTAGENGGDGSEPMQAHGISIEKFKEGSDLYFIIKVTWGTNAQINRDRSGRTDWNSNTIGWGNFYDSFGDRAPDPRGGTGYGINWPFVPAANREGQWWSAFFVNSERITKHANKYFPDIHAETDPRIRVGTKLPQNVPTPLYPNAMVSQPVLTDGFIPEIGLANYPTIKFQIIGYPDPWETDHTSFGNLNLPNAVLNLGSVIT